MDSEVYLRNDSIRLFSGKSWLHKLLFNPKVIGKVKISAFKISIYLFDVSFY